ncbi:YHS domain protein [Fulvivirga imtechensis AK7]|uniref:YHS domain protein n=1 Tax=Fulvivirga imtechensis AK7 TaxID=1237149 RepID=L8JP46_9BACT|nr:YHS domain-containing (seleno)protein [Fulvivirga imtechensis]ELR69973.1 YHS domain protein [Fulvivirga imtechensis AK7]
MRIILFSVLLIAAGSAFSQSSAKRNKTFNLTKGIAIEGYDPVSYFSGKPRQGDEKLSYTHKGVTYLFSNAANRQKFISSPDGYEPQYGGWCAYAIGESGKKIKIDPLTYKIADGKLYLFYNFNGYNTLENWNKNEKPLKTAADKNWQSIVE